MKRLLTPAVWAAFLVTVIGYACLALEAQAPWLVAWPAEATLPLTDWLGRGVEWMLGWMKPGARDFAGLLGYPMEATKWVLTRSPWPLVTGVVVALAWYLGRFWAALGALLGMGFIVLSGYWEEAMITLSLVAVSVPLALVLGLFIGLLAFEIRWLRGPVQAVLDFMQTMPTFAYLTPLLVLFGFGPVVGLIASAIYAAPPMARNVILGLERVDPEMREAAVMSGAVRRQQLFGVEMPAARAQIMQGVNQSLMAALSMVIIAAVIGGFGDIGWEVLLKMRQAKFGPALLAGAVIVVFAILIDRLSRRLGPDMARGHWLIALVILALGATLGSIGWAVDLPGQELSWVNRITTGIDAGLSAYITENGLRLDAGKNAAMFYGLLPLRIGLDTAVLEFTWGFNWTPVMSLGFFALVSGGCVWLLVTGRPVAGLSLAIAALVLETGVVQLPWPFVFAGTAALAYCAKGWRLALLCVGLLLLIALAGFWERALLSIYLCGAAVAACTVVGGMLGLAGAVSRPVWAVLQVLCDTLQTIPLFVFLIPVVMFFQISEFSAFLAICLYAIVPMIRYTRAGLISTPDDLLEAAVASGATGWQRLWSVRAPYAAPQILLGLNQTILFAFAMLVITALVGTTGLGQLIYTAIGQADVGLGLAAGAAMAALALIADRLVQGFAAQRRTALGL